VQRPSDSRFPWLLWLIAGAVAIGVGFAVEQRVDAALDVTKNPSAERFAWWCSKIGEGQIVGGVGILFAAIYFFLNRPRRAAQIFFVAGSALLIGLAGTIIRVLVGRTRPEAHGPQGVPPGFYGVWHDGHWIIGQAAFSAFPSGHAAVAAGLAVTATLLHRGWGAVAWVYALAVMWSRVALQWHHLSDVLASAVLAFPLAWALKKFLAPTVDFHFDNLHRTWKRR
jgi:membrane-associated phospholipid phosphatase